MKPPQHETDLKTAMRLMNFPPTLEVVTRGRSSRVMSGSNILRLWDDGDITLNGGKFDGSLWDAVKAFATAIHEEGVGRQQMIL